VDHVIRASLIQKTSTENLLIGAVNAENDKVNLVRNRMTGKYDTVPSVAK
jgi:hypothetical protein